MASWTILLLALTSSLFVQTTRGGQTLLHRERLRMVPAIHNRQDQRHVDQPWWTENDDDPAPVLYQKLARANLQDVPSVPLTTPAGDKSDITNFLYGRDGKDGPMKHIMRLLRILPPKDPIKYTDNGDPFPYVSAVPTLSPVPGRPSGLDRMCSAGVEPMFVSGYYRYCDPRNATNGCPNGYVCDYSLYITTYICCTERSSSTYRDKSSTSTTTTTLSTFATRPATIPIEPALLTTPSIWEAIANETLQLINESATASANRWSPWSTWSEWVPTSEPPTSSSSSPKPPTTEPGTNGWPSLPPYPEIPQPTNNVFPSLPPYPIGATNTNWPSLPPYPYEPNSIASILSNFPNPDVFPFQLTPSSVPLPPFQTVWETTDAEIESQWTLFPGFTPPLWTSHPQIASTVTNSPQSPKAMSTSVSSSASPTITESKPPTTTTKTTFLPPIPTPNVFQISNVEVIPLTSGNVVSLPNGDFEWTSTITLIRDGEKTILVDTGLPTDTNLLIRELSRHGIRPENVDMVVITHGHPDHFGNQNLFSRKVQLFSSFEFLGNKFSRTSLADHQFRRITPHVEIWKTPGHTPEDLSVIVRDVPTLGTVAVVGDLIVNEDFLLNPTQWANSGSWDRIVQQHNINTIVCMVDCIVPGHGPVFRLHDAHRRNSNCEQRFGNKYSNYFG